MTRTHHVTLIPGDGIGPEVTEAARRVIDATGVAIEWDVQLAGVAAHQTSGTTLPISTVSSIRERGAALKGPTSTATGGGRSANLELRSELGLHTGIRPCRSFPGLRVPFADLDLVVIRMTGEDLYAGIEFEAGSEGAASLRAMVEAASGIQTAPDSGFSVKPLSASAAAKTLRFGYRWAREQRRSRITVAHKATVMRATDGVFLRLARELADSLGDGLVVDELLVDTLCGELARRPGVFDVLVMQVLYGDLVSDLTAGLIGGPGMAPGFNVGDSCAVFEAVHGSAPKHTGAGRANPLAAVLTGAWLLRHLGETSDARAIEDAVAALILRGETLTYDLRAPEDDRPPASTGEVADSLVEMLEA